MEESHVLIFNSDIPGAFQAPISYARNDGPCVYEMSGRALEDPTYVGFSSVGLHRVFRKSCTRYEPFRAKAFGEARLITVRFFRRSIEARETERQRIHQIHPIYNRACEVCFAQGLKHPDYQSMAKDLSTMFGGNPGQMIMAAIGFSGLYGRMLKHPEEFLSFRMGNIPPREAAARIRAALGSL